MIAFNISANLPQIKLLNTKNGLNNGNFVISILKFKIGWRLYLGYSTALEFCNSKLSMKANEIME